MEGHENEEKWAHKRPQKELSADRKSRRTVSIGVHYVKESSCMNTQMIRTQILPQQLGQTTKEDQEDEWPPRIAAAKEINVDATEVVKIQSPNNK